MAIERVVEREVPDGEEIRDVLAIVSQGAFLTIELETIRAQVTLRFESPVGLRVLDEGDLVEFWPTCSLENGYLHRIERGGWKDHESKRGGFMSGSDPKLFEWLVVTENECVSVLAYRPPLVHHVI